MPSPTRRAISALLLLALAFAAALPPAPAARAQPPALSGAPAAIEAAVALGASAEVSLTLRNESGAPLTPRLLEAYAATPRAAAARPPARAPLPQQADRVDPALRAALAAGPGAEAEFLVILADQADLSAAYAVRDWAARGELVYRTLREHAAATQGALRAELDARGLRYTPLWIVNALAVQGDAAAVSALAAHAEVAQLRATRTASLGAPPAQVESATCSADAQNSCWNIGRVGADRVWSEFGARGEGIVVANIDSGVRFDHPALLSQYRGSTGAGVDHNYSWFDLFGASPSPVDSGNHGTHTMGTMVAAGRSAAEPAVGVAPGARWIAARACGSRSCSELNLIRAAQWILAPTDLAGNSPRPELRPHVVNNSWSEGQNTTWFAGYTAAWRAAGIYPVFAAGNSGNARCATVQSPGDYADVTAAGAVDRSDRLTTFSAVGPGPGGRLKPDLTAPGAGIWSTAADPARPYTSLDGTSMAAPHIAGAAALLLAANPALIGDYDATYAALTAGARPMTGDARFLGDAYAACAPLTAPNNIYGHGILDAYGAVARAAIDVPWLALPAQGAPQLAAGASADVRVTLDARRVPAPGTYQARVLVHGPDLSRPPLAVPVTMTVPAEPQHAVVTGRLTRAGDGAPIRGTVAVAGGATAATDAEGRYSLTLPPAAAPYTLTADARDYVSRSATAQLGPAARATLDFALQPDTPRLAADGSLRTAALDFARRADLPLALTNEGSGVLTYTASVPAELFGVWRSDEPDGPAPAWADPPADAVTLPLQDDDSSGPLPIGFAFPFLSGSYEELYVSANGVIGFSPLAQGSPFVKSCLPLLETPGPAIAALRADLDPTRPGARVSLARAEGGALITWENVPLYSDETSRLSFQALLLPDGRVSLRYRAVGGLRPADFPSYGLQYGTGDVQSLGCEKDLGLTPGLTIELRPQPAASLWLAVGPALGQVEPGATLPLGLAARWVRPPADGRPMSGAVVIRTNDPLRPELRVTVRLTAGEAPNSTHLPSVLSRARVRAGP